MKRKDTLILALLLIIIVCGPAEGARIGSFNFAHKGTVSNETFSSTHVKAWIQEGTTMYKIFDTVTISQASAGSTILATAGAGFNDFTKFLTDGNNSVLAFGIEQLLTVQHESDFFSTSPDFSGYTINEIELNVNHALFDTQAGASDHPYTNYDVDMDFYIEGERNTAGPPVPEPATMLLFGAGLVGLAGFGRKKFKK